METRTPEDRERSDRGQPDDHGGGDEIERDVVPIGGREVLDRSQETRSEPLGIDGDGTGIMHRTDDSAGGCLPFRGHPGAIHRHRAVCAIILAHPALIPDLCESLIQIDSGDAALESLKKAAIDAVIRDPDLDAAALRHHLFGLKLTDAINVLEGGEMRARMPFNPATLDGEEAGQRLDELLRLVGGSSGLFSTSASLPR